MRTYYTIVLHDIRFTVIKIFDKEKDAYEYKTSANKANEENGSHIRYFYKKYEVSDSLRNEIINDKEIDIKRKEKKYKMPYKLIQKIREGIENN